MHNDSLKSEIKCCLSHPKGVFKGHTNLTAIQCHEIEMLMTLSSIFFLSSLISRHIKHLQKYVKKMKLYLHSKFKL